MANKTIADYQKDISNIDNQIAQLNQLRQRTIDMYSRGIGNSPSTGESLWNKIDTEISNCDKYVLDIICKDERYIAINNQLNNIVQQELLLLVRDKVEQREDGKRLLEKQLEIVKSIKESSKEQRDEEMMLFARFKEYSKLHPATTYEEFLTKMK